MSGGDIDRPERDRPGWQEWQRLPPINAVDELRDGHVYFLPTGERVHAEKVLRRGAHAVWTIVGAGRKYSVRADGSLWLRSEIEGGRIWTPIEEIPTDLTVRDLTPIDDASEESG